MGFESFQVKLQGTGVYHAEADAAVRRLPHARPDPDALRTTGSTYYTVEDGRHVIEVEVGPSAGRISCRFTLCHPPTVDAAFLALVRELMTDLAGMEATICDDVRPEHGRPFSATEFAEFSTAVSEAAAARRAEWVANFGPEMYPAKTHEAFERFVLPRYETVTE